MSEASRRPEEVCIVSVMAVIASLLSYIEVITASQLYTESIPKPHDAVKNLQLIVIPFETAKMDARNKSVNFNDLEKMMIKYAVT